MDRMLAWEELNLRVESPSLLRHCLAVEAIMHRLAIHLEEDPVLWAIAGLLHDIDAERVRQEPEQKGIMAAEILRNLEADPAIIHAVEASVPGTKKPRRRAIDKALVLADAAADLILGAALEHPEKRLRVLSVALLLKRHEANRISCPKKREALEACTDLGLSREQIYTLALEAMTGIGDALGL